MKKLLLSILLLALALPPALAGEQTITISRNDGQFDNAQGVYYASKGGVTMTMSGGMNNTNFLVLRHQNTVTFRSANFAIKKIIFHCLDNFEEGNNDVFYWGPTTMNVMTVNYKPVGSSTTTPVVPGKFTASGYDGTWVSSFSGTWTSTFRPTSGSGTETRTHTSFANGWPAGNQLIFGSLGKPIRFSSIDIVVEKEDGDIYDLVTNVSQIQDQHNYLIVNWENAKALSVNTKAGRNSKDVRTGSPVEFIPGQIDGTNDQYAKVKTDGEAQIIKFEKHTLPISTSSGKINDSRAWTFNAGGNYLRIYSTAATNLSGNNGPDLYGESTIDPEWSYAAIWLGNSDVGYNVRIRFRDMSSTDYPRPTSSTYQIGYNRTNNYFRDLDYVNYSSATAQQVRLYTPAYNYNVTTEVQPNASSGTIALRDGVIVSDNTYTSGTSQQYEVVSFLVTAADGKKISNVTIQAGTETIEPESSTHTTNGTLYTFVMPASDVHIIAEFAEVQYHNIYTEVAPSVDYGNIFLTDGYVVQQDQVKSYDGETVVFNVTPNLIDIDDESKGYHELYSVEVTNKDTGEEIPYTYADGNYTFTMPDADVTITATFIYDNGNPLYLLGTANGGEFLPYGPRFNYDTTNQEYYIDVYFKGTNEFGGNTDDAYGYFCLSWGKWTTWDQVNQQTRRGQPYDNNYLISTDAPQYTLCYDDSRQNAFKIPAGIYRIYVKSYGYHNDVLRIERTYPSLSFDPAGGATAAEAVEVPQGQVVTLNGDLYNKIKAINPNEADANFYYKTVETIDGTAETNTTNGSATGSASLDVVNDGETVTKLEGWNYLGWIVADNSGYYKVISTPLAWIEEHGKVGQTYTVADKLLVVWTPENSNTPSFWVKDLPTTEHPEGLSIDKTAPANGQIDYMMSNNYTAREGGWDQSNWIELDCSGLSTGDIVPAITNYIPGGKLKGVYTDNKNYKMRVISIDEVTTGEEYVRNKYCTANFLENNLMLTENSTGPQSAVTGKYYYFLNPKVQEYATITYAMWDAENQEFIVPSAGNANGFSGALKLGGWDYNVATADAVLPALDKNAGTKQYEFRAIIHRENYNYGHNPNATGNNLMRAALSSPNITVWPIDLTDNASVVTAVSDVNAAAQVKHVEYVNIAGQRSVTPWQGVNIVVTHYDNGTTKAVKVIK